MRIQLLAAIILLLSAQHVKGQEVSSPVVDKTQSINGFPEMYLQSVNKKADKLTGSIDKQTQKYLSKLQKQEAKIRKKLSRIDPVAAGSIFTDTDKKYQQIKNELKNKSTSLSNAGGQYIPGLDSISTSLNFLASNESYRNFTRGKEQLITALEKMKLLENESRRAEEIKEFVRQRKMYLKTQLNRFGLGDKLNTYNKQAYYYFRQIEEFKGALNEPDKIERQTLALLNKLPAFRTFMRKNSMLSGLFSVPDDNPMDQNNLQSIAGLQTREQLSQVIQNKFGPVNLNATNSAQTNLTDVRNQMQQLQNKLTQYGIGATDKEMPDFKPNAQKTKTFSQRLVYNLDLQTIPASGFIPVTSDIGLSMGYKINEKSVIGLGAGVKLGWGKNFQHLHFSGQGLTFRNYVDIKLKGSIWISGGYEMNYWSEFRKIDQLRNMSYWRQSGLVGISKVIPLKANFFKQSKLQLLWDFLSYRQIPRTSPLVFRFAYGFK